MNLKSMLEPKGLNWWTIVSGMGMNFILTAVLFFMITGLTEIENGQILYTLAMSASGFLIPLFTAYICGRLSDERFMAYAFYPLIGYMILAVPGILIAGAFGFLIVAFGVLGAFNGATLAARRAMRRRHTLSDD